MSSSTIQILFPSHSFCLSLYNMERCKVIYILPLHSFRAKYMRLCCYTGIGRKNETDYNGCSSLTSYLGHPKPSFDCVRKLFTIINNFPIENYIGDVPKLFKRVLQMVLRIILSAYSCILRVNGKVQWSAYLSIQ